MRWRPGLPGGAGLQLALKEVRIWVGEVECSRWAHHDERHRSGKGDLFGVSGTLEELPAWSLEWLDMIKGNSNGWVLFYLSSDLVFLLFISPVSLDQVLNKCTFKKN